MTSDIDITHEEPKEGRGRLFIGGVIVSLALLTVSLDTVNLIAADNLREADKAQRAEDVAQRECIEDSFAALSAALTTRAENSDELNRLRDRDRNITTDQLVALINLLLLSSQDNDTPAEQAALLKQFLTDVETFTEARKGIKEDIREFVQKQKSTPIPPYPEGKCDDAEEADDGESE